MTELLLPWCLGVLGLCFGMAVYRLVRGPTLSDRVLALDTLYIYAAGMLILLGKMLATKVYFEAALLIALLGFVGTVVFGKFVLRRDLIE